MGKRERSIITALPPLLPRLRTGELQRMAGARSTVQETTQLYEKYPADNTFSFSLLLLKNWRISVVHTATASAAVGRTRTGAGLGLERAGGGIAGRKMREGGALLCSI